MMDSVGASESFEDKSLPIIIIGHIPRFSRNEQICLHAHFACPANNEIVNGLSVTKNPEFGLFAFRLTVIPSSPFYIRLQRWATIRMSALHQQQQQQSRAAERGVEAGDAQVESITVLERHERKMIISRPWTIVFIEWDQQTQTLMHTNATEPRHLFVGKYPTKKFPPSTHFCVRSSVNGWRVNPRLTDGCQFPENSGLYWTWVDANARERTEFKMVATIDDDNLNCTIVVWEPLPFMNKVLGQPMYNALFVLFSEWGVYDLKYTVIALDKVMLFDSKLMQHAQLPRRHGESNPVSMWQKFLGSRTHETTGGDPGKSASATSLLTVEAAGEVQDEVEIVFCTSCDQKDLGRELEQFSLKRELSGFGGHVPGHPRFPSSKVDDRNVRGIIPGMVVDATDRDRPTPASKATGVIPFGYALDLNVEKSRTYDRKTLLNVNPYAKQEKVSNPNTLARLCKDISESVEKSAEANGGELHSQNDQFSNGNRGKVTQASDAICHSGDEKLPQKKSSRDDSATLKTFDLVDESRKVRNFGIATSKAKFSVCGGDEDKKHYDNIDASDQRGTLNPNAAEAFRDLSFEAALLPSSDSDEEWLVSEHAIDSSVAEIVKETESPRKLRDQESESKPPPSSETDHLANLSLSDDPDGCCHLTETKNQECNARGDTGTGNAQGDDSGKGKLIQLTQTFAICEGSDRTFFIKNVLASEMCVDRSASPETTVWKTFEGKSGADEPSPNRDVVEEQFGKVSDCFQVDLFSVFPPADVNDVLPVLDVAEKEDVSSPIVGVDVADLLYDFEATGVSNTGVRNTGARNTGVSNTGARNTGVSNTGARNTGVSNTGVSNTGISNTGTRNAGARNTGASNTGASNTGAGNSGASNEGDAQYNSTAVVGDPDLGWFKKEAGTHTVGSPAGDDECLISWGAAVGNPVDHPTNDSMTSSAVFGSPMAHSSLMTLHTFGHSFNNTSLISRNIPENVADHPVKKRSLITNRTLDECSTYASADSHITVTSEERKGRNLDAACSIDNTSPINQYSIDGLFDLSVNGTSLTNLDQYSASASTDTRNIVTPTEIRIRSSFARSVYETTKAVRDAAKKPAGRLVNDSSLINFDECSLYPIADAQNILTSAQTKDGGLATRSSQVTESGRNETSQTDEYSRFAVPDTQNVMSSAEIKGVDLITHLIDNLNLTAELDNGNQSDLSRNDSNLISLDDFSNSQNIVASSEVKSMKPTAYSVHDGAPMNQGAAGDMTEHSVNDTSPMIHDTSSSYAESDSQNVVGSDEKKASNVAVMELYPCEERHYKAYQYFVNQIRRTQDCPRYPVDRKSLNDLIPYFEVDEVTESPMPEMPAENLNTNNETLDFDDPPEVRGVTRSQLEHYSQSIVLSGKRERNRSGVSNDEHHSQELPAIPEEDLPNDGSEEQWDGIALFEYSSASDDVEVEAETFREPPAFRQTYSERSERGMFRSTKRSPVHFGDVHYSSQRGDDLTMTESVKQKEDTGKMLAEAADMAEEKEDSSEEYESYEDAQDDVDAIPIKYEEEKCEENNLKIFRPYLPNCSDFATTQTYPTLCESPAPPKTFYTISGECCFLDESESTKNCRDDAVTSNPSELPADNGELPADNGELPADNGELPADNGGDVASRWSEEKGSSSLHEKCVDKNPLSENSDVLRDSLKVFVIHSEGDYQVQQSMDWTTVHSHRQVKPFEEKWKVSEGSGESGEIQSVPPTDSECLKEDKPSSSADQNLSLNRMEEETEDSEGKRLIRDLKDFARTAEDSLKVFGDDDSNAVFRPQLTSNLPRVDWNEARRGSLTAAFGVDNDDFYSINRDRNHCNLTDFECDQSFPATGDQESTDISTEEDSHPGLKVFRVPKCVLKGIVNYENDYDDVVTAVDEVTKPAADGISSEPKLPRVTTLPKDSYCECCANNENISDGDISCCARNTCGNNCSLDVTNQSSIRYLSTVSFAETCHGCTQKNKGSCCGDLAGLNTATPLSSRSAECSGGLAGRCHQRNALPRVLPMNRFNLSDAGCVSTCQSTHPTEAESLQLPGPESILHPCLEAWFCSETARNGKPNSFMIESEAQTEEESTGLLANISEGTRPKIAEGNAAVDFAEQVTRYGTAGFTIQCADRCKSPVKSSGSYSGPEADASESSINEGCGNYSLTDSDSGEKCVPQGASFIPSAYVEGCDSFTGNVATETAGLAEACRPLIDLDDESKVGLTSDDRTKDEGCDTPSSYCEKSVLESTPPEWNDRRKLNLEVGGRSGFNCLVGRDSSLPFEDDWYLDFEHDEMDDKKQKRLKEILARDPDFQRILDGKTSFVCSPYQSMDFVLEDDAFEEESTEDENEMVMEETNEEGLKEEDKEEKEENSGQGVEQIKNPLYFMTLPPPPSSPPPPPPPVETDKSKEEKPKVEEQMAMEKNKERTKEEVKLLEKEQDSGQYDERFQDPLYFMNRPPSPFADDWFTDTGPSRFEEQFTQGSTACEDFIRKTTIALEKYYQQALAGNCTVARQIKQVPLVRDPTENEKELTSDNVFLPGVLPPEMDQQGILRADDASMDSVYLTPVFSPFLDDVAMDPCSCDSPDFVHSEGLESSNFASCCSSKDFTDTFCVPRTPVSHLDLVSDVLRGLRSVAADDAKLQRISVENVPDNDQNPAHDVAGVQTLSSGNIPDNLDAASLRSTPDESSWGTAPDKEGLDSSGSSFLSVPQVDGSTMDVVADCLVKKAIDFAQHKILMTTNSMPFNLRVTDDCCGEEGEARAYLPRSTSALLPQVNRSPNEDEDLKG